MSIDIKQLHTDSKIIITYKFTPTNQQELDFFMTHFDKGKYRGKIIHDKKNHICPICEEMRSNKYNQEWICVRSTFVKQKDTT